MTGQMKIIVAVPPEFSRADIGISQQAAHMMYRIGRGFRLYRAPAAGVSGGYMVLDTGGFRGGGPVSALVSDILDECGRMGYIGIVIDAGEGGGTPAQLSLSRAVAVAARKTGLTYFVPDSLSDSGYNAIIRIPTALSGGTLCRYLSDAVKKYNVKRVAIEVERIRMDFALPSLNGVGKALSKDALRDLREEHNSESFFSPDLAVNYFTYTDKKCAHFVLYDDEMSIRSKLAVAAGLGIEYAFLYYPHVADILALL